MPDEPADHAEELVFRRGKLRKRDDYAVDLFKEALALLAGAETPPDRVRIQRLLVDLGRFYNPVTNGPVLDARGRREVLEALDADRPDQARRILETRLRAYTRLDRPPTGPAATSPEPPPTH